MSRPAIVAVFETFRDELDEHNDRRERLIKVGEKGVFHLFFFPPATLAACQLRLNFLLEQPRCHQPVQKGYLFATQNHD
jgi:hypothetical protein